MTSRLVRWAPAIGPALEWLVLLGIMLWVLGASLTWWRHARVDRATA